jgi:di/tricarboxylate transporter
MITIYVIILIAIITFLIIDTEESRRRLISILGIIVILVLGWIFSKYPGKASKLYPEVKFYDCHVNLQDWVVQKLRIKQ